MFRDLLLGQLALKAASPCLDAADFDQLPQDVFDLDFDGISIDMPGLLGETVPIDIRANPRWIDDPAANMGMPMGGVTYLDMGAYER